jgi:hypothetical protein
MNLLTISKMYSPIHGANLALLSMDFEIFLGRGFQVWQHPSAPDFLPYGVMTHLPNTATSSGMPEGSEREHRLQTNRKHGLHFKSDSSMHQ